MKNKKIVLAVALITLIICGIIILVAVKPKEKEKTPKAAAVTNSIEKYGYNLLDIDTKYFKELFNKLQKTLKEDSIDEELYATLVSQLFVTDFYTLSNKLGSSDVGGLEYVKEDIRDNFSLKARDTMYKSVESNLYGDRNQELPTVTKVSVDNIGTTTYKGFDAYNVKCSVTYEKSMGYPEVVKLILAKNDFKLEVAKVD